MQKAQHINSRDSIAKDVTVDSQKLNVNEFEVQNSEDNTSIWTKKSIYRAWLLLCFSTGPVASMSRTYVPATIQSIGRAIGKSKSGEKCLFKGNDCYVKFGAGTVHFTSYVLYLRAISTALEGVVAILLMGIADYSNYRKWFLIGSIFIYGILALPFAALTGTNYPTMRALSALYVLISVDNSIYQILEGSYIPLFMRASSSKGTVAEEVRRDMVLKRGSVVSVMGIFLGNCGGLVALLIGIIISHSRGGPIKDGYHNFLLAITISGATTVIFSIISSFFIPRVKGKEKPKDQNLLILSLKRFILLSKDIRKYPHAFTYCISWVIWNVSYNNFMSVFILLFRSTLGLGSSDAEYTVYTFMSYIMASLGSLFWMWVYPRTKLGIKAWGYMFLVFAAFSNFWGCLGIGPRTKIGFKHRWEFWIFEVFYSASGSALRSLNRTVYSTLLPEGEEAQYFGLEIMLGVATGWIGSLVNATIQDRTNNDRFPFLPNLFLGLIAIIFYYFSDIEKGMKDVEKLVQQEQNRSPHYQSTEE